MAPVTYHASPEARKAATVAASNFNRYWTLIIILLIAIVVTGGIVAWARYSPERPVEISLPQDQGWSGEIYIDGAVTNPGFYPFTSEDSVEVLMQAAGGATSHADFNGLELYIPEVGEAPEPQKVDINRAEVWLLKALPGIGETLAQRIVDYRQQHGPFLNINQIVKVAGIGDATYQQIEHLITVAD